MMHLGLDRDRRSGRHNSVVNRLFDGLQGNWQRFRMTLQQRFNISPATFNFGTYAVAIFMIMLFWSYLQEKLTSTEYKNVFFSAVHSSEESISLSEATCTWNYPIFLNVCLATFASGTAFFAQMLQSSEDRHDLDDKGGKKTASMSVYWKVALAMCVGSPLGYKALKYLSYPLMILTKSTKPIPVMFVGSVLYKRKYPWYKYIGVVMLCSGVALYSISKNGGAAAAASGNSRSSRTTIEDGIAAENEVESSASAIILTGIVLIGINLSLDGIANNEQDKIFSVYGATPLDMMKINNLWIGLYLVSWLYLSGLIWGTESELYLALRSIGRCPGIALDMIVFCLCNSVGQLLISSFVKQFGSLTWITMNLIRQFCTILLSVYIFKHSIGLVQYMGILLVFGGVALDLTMSSGVLTESMVSKFTLMLGVDISKFIEIKSSDNGMHPKSNTGSRTNPNLRASASSQPSKASLSLSKPTRTRQISADTLEMGEIGAAGKSPVKND